MAGSSSTEQIAAAFGWPPIMRLAVACVYTSRSRWTLQRAVARGELVAAGRQGRSLTFRREDLDRWLLGSASNDEQLRVVPRPARQQAVATATSDALERLRQVTRGGGQ